MIQTAARIAACRPELPIVAVTPNKRVAQQLSLSYATRSYVREEGEHVGTKLAKELLDWGTFGNNNKLTTIIISGRQSNITDGALSGRRRPHHGHTLPPL